jgi:transcriptional regulator with XRE-family HTH domain
VNFRDEGILDSFAKRFKKIRLREGLTQEELAYRAEISLSQVARIETGKINPTLCTIVVLAKTLKVHPMELMDFDF